MVKIIDLTPPVVGPTWTLRFVGAYRQDIRAITHHFLLHGNASDGWDTLRIVVWMVEHEDIGPWIA